MVQVSYPGVYIQEVPSGVRTITGVSTSITAFIGVAASGPMFVPTTVLNFTDYTRAFSGDTSAGEMTDQVRQFFLNGGSQAVIVRIANAPQVSNTILNKADGSPALTLLARSQGKSGDALRARVDYNTPSPERTFNLTVYTESFDSAGNASAGATETFPNVSVDPSDPRFVKTILEANSALVGTVTVNGGTAIAPYSMSGLIFPANTDVSEKVIADIAAATTSPTATDGKFVVRVGANTHVVTIPKTPVGADAAARLTWLLASINEDLGGEATATIPAVSPGHFALVITANSPTGPGDVVIERAPDSDIALGSRLGTAQGGVEFGRMATHRPAPNGFVSVASSLPAEINAATLMDTLDIVTTEFGNGFQLNGSIPFVVTAAVAGIGTPLGAGSADPGLSLNNLRANLQLVANAINAATTRWVAQVHGVRLALIPLGAASNGPSHTFAGTPPGWFDDAVARSAATAFGGGSDGSAPTAPDYTKAFDALDSKVDLYNIVVLCRTGNGLDPTRRDYFGTASTRCQQRRAFLLIESDSDVTDIDKVISDVKARRIGTVKDHSALYWPRLRVNPDGKARFIDPGGSIAGIMARIDNARGVWKAPAGLDADVRGVLGVQVPMSDPENGRINPEAVNAIRVFPNGVISWGARTLDGFDNSGNDDYKYVPVRRLALFLEESLVRGLKFAVFEPNDEPLWAQIRTAVGSFLNTLFRQGAFQGRTPRDAYFVKVDSETTTQNDINLGIVNVVVGFAPLKPAEFVVITIQQKAGQVQV